MRALIWLARAALFFLLFAFALNNQNETTLHWFFGAQWQAPMVFIVLAAFAVGCAVGVLAMVPSWWRHRRAAMRQLLPGTVAEAPAVVAPSPDAPPTHPPREGL